MTKTHTMRSRLISLVLVLVMVLGCLPLSALAADPALESTFVPVGGDQTFGDFHVRASVTDGYKLQTVGLETTEQNVGMTLRLYYNGTANTTDKTLRIKLYDGDSNCIRLIDVKVSTDTNGYTAASVSASYENGDPQKPDTGVWLPTARVNGRELLVEGIHVKLTGSGNFPLKASITGSGANTTEQIQLLGSFDIKGYSVDVPTVNLTFNLDATDAYYAYSTVTIEKDQEYTLPTVTPIRENYTFMGWKDADGNDVTGSISADKTGSDLMLTAVWEQNVVTSHTVTYSAGDSVTDANYIPSAATVVDGSEYTIPAVIPTRPGYTFVQWVDGNDNHQPGDTITVNDNVTLTAQWSENEVTITWPTLPTGVTAGTDWNTNATVGEGATVTFQLSLETGYDPSTLMVTANGAALVGVQQTGTTVYEYSFVASSDTTIAVSAPSKLAYTVLLPSGNFTAAFTAPTTYLNQTSAVVEYGSNYSFTVKPHTGYKILAIYINGTKRVVDPTWAGVYTVNVENVTGPQNIRVDAEEVQTYAVTFVVPQLGQTLVQYVDEGGQATKPVVNPILAGYEFDDWYTDVEYNKADGTAYDFENTVVTGDLVLYGKLTAKTYTVTYNSNAGTDTVSNVPTNGTKTHGVAYTLSTDVPTRTGYTFLGWSTSQTGAVVYQPGEVYSTDADLTLYAVWQKNTYTVTLPSGAGYTVTPAGMGTVEYGEDFTFTVVVDRAYAATAPTVTAKDSLNGDVGVTPNGTTSNTSAVTYTYTIANVTDNLSVSIDVTQNDTYTVKYFQSFDKTAAANPFNVQMVEHGYYTTAPVAPEVDGYTFQGWFEDAAGNTAYDFTEIITKNTEIYAVYVKKTYEVKDPTAGTGWEYSAQSASPVKHGEDFSFTVTVKEGYDATNMVVGVNGFVLAPDSVAASTTNEKDTVYSYTIRNITEDKAISVTGVVRKTVTIVYNNNGGIGGPTTQVVKYYLVDDNSLISTIKPTRDGYTFLGWAKADADGSIPTVPAYSNPATADPATSDTADFTEDTVLYAVWQAKATAVTLTVAPADQQYEGSEVTLTATVPTGGTGSVLFYRDNADPDSDELVGTSNVSGDKATATVVVKDYVAGNATDSFYAVFKPTDGAGYQESTSAVVSVTVRSTAITWGVDAEGNVLSELDIAGTLDDDGKMIAGQTYELTIPDVYALDDDDHDTPVTNYTVTWEKKTADGDWAQIANADDDTYIVTAYNEGDQYRAKLTPTDPYNKAVNNPTNVSYTATLVTGETEEAVKQATEIALTVTDTHDYTTGDDGTNVVAEFEGQKVTLTAYVTYDGKAVTTGYVQFYRDEVKVGNEIGEPVAVNGNNGTATIEATMSSYEKDGKVDSYIAKYLTNETYKESVSEAKEVQIRSTAIVWGENGTEENRALIVSKFNTETGETTLYNGTLMAGETYQLELPDVFERDLASIGELTVNKDYRVDWYQFNADATQGQLIASLANQDTVTVKPETNNVGYYAIVTPVDGSNYTKAWTVVEGDWAYNNFLITATEERSGATPTEIALTIDGAVAMGNSWEQYEGRTITLNAEVNVDGSETTMVEHGNVSFYVITKQEGQDQVTATSELIGGQPVAVVNGMASVTYELPEYLLDEDLDNIEYFYAVYEDVSTELSEEVRYASSTTARVSGLDEDITTENIPEQNQLQVRSIAITWQLNADKTAIADGANDITIYSYNANNAADGYKGDKLNSVMDADETYVLEMPGVYAYDAVTDTEPLAIGTDYTVQWQYYVKDTESWMDYKGKDAYSASIVVTPEYHDYGFRVQVTPKYDNDSLTGFRKAAKYDGAEVIALNFQVLYSDTTVPTDRKGTATDLTITGADWELQNVMVDGKNNTFTADHYAQFEGQTVTLKATVTEAENADVMIPNGYVYFYRYEGEGQTVLLNATPVEVKDGIAELEVKITSYDVTKDVTENADKFFAVYEPNDTYDGSASTTKTGTAYDEPEAVDWVYIKSTSINTPIVESKLPGKIEGQDDPAYATTYKKNLTELQAGVEHTFTLRQEAKMDKADYSVVALDGRYVEKNNYTIQWLVKNGDNEETTAAKNVNPYVTTTTKTGDMYRLWLEPKGDMTVGAYSKHLIVGTKQLVNVTVVASDEIEATEETDVYQLNDITLTATVEGAEPENTMKPTGTVTFYYRTKDTTSAWTEIGEAALAEDSVTGKMVATLVTDELPVDAAKYTKRDLQIYAIYNGDETFQVSATAKKVQDEELFNIAGTEGSTTVDDIVTVYSSVVKRSPMENTPNTPTTAPDGKDGLMAYVDGNLMVNEENVTLMLSDLYTLDGAEVDAVISKLTHGTDYTIIWQELTNYESYKNADLNDAPWTNLNDSDTHQYNVNVKQGAAYRAMITVKDTAPVQGSFTEVLQADADDATSGSKIYYTNILVPTLGQSTLSYNITSSVQNQENSEGIVEGETATVHVYINGATETTPISSLTVSITKQGETEPVYTDTRYSVNGYTAIDWKTEEGDAGYYTLTIEAVPSNGYEPETLTRTIIVRDNTYTLNVSNLNPTYNGKTQGVSVTVEGMDIEADLAAKSWTVTYTDANGNKVEPSQAGTYTYTATLPASAYWTEKTVEGTFTIEKRQVSVADLVAQAKVYDGTTDVNLLEIVLDDAETAQSTTGLPTNKFGVINGDSVYATGTGYTASANAGTTELGVKDVELKGDDAGNYILNSTSYTEDFTIQRNQLQGDVADATYQYTGSSITVPADDIHLIDQQGNVVTDYTVTYYYHNGEGVEKVAAMKDLGMYTIVVNKDPANYKGGASQIVYVSNAAQDAAPSKDFESATVDITNTVELYGESTGIVATASTGTVSTIEYRVGTAWTTTVPTNAGRYLVKVTTSTDDVAYGIYTIVKANPVLTLNAAGTTYDSALYEVSNVTGTYNGGTFGELDYYYTYAGDVVIGEHGSDSGVNVDFQAPHDAGTYVVTVHVPETDNYTAEEYSTSFTIAHKELVIKANDKQRHLYSAYPDMLATYEGLATDGVAMDTSLRDIQIMPEFNYDNHNNDSESHVGYYTVTPVDALAKNYVVVDYVPGEFSVNENDPQPTLSIVGAPQNGMNDGKTYAYYGDVIQLYAYGNQKDGVINKSSVLTWEVVSGHAVIDQTGLLTITGTGNIVVKLTRGTGRTAISTELTITALKKEVQVIVPDQDLVYNGASQTYTGVMTAVDDAYNAVNADLVTITESNKDRTEVGSQIVTGIVAQDGNLYYQSETYGGLFTINDKEINIEPVGKETVYGTKVEGLTYREVTRVNSVAALTDGFAVSVADAYDNLDVLDGYEILVAGRENINYNVKYVTDQTAEDVQVTEKALTIKTGSYADTIGKTGGSLNPAGDYPVNGAIVDPAALFETDGMRMYGEPNQVMGFVLETLIAGDSVADVNALLDWLVEFDIDDHYLIDEDANITYPTKDTTKDHVVELDGTVRNYDLHIGTEMDFHNYDVTVQEGTQNIYQRPVTLTTRNGITLSAFRDSILDGSNPDQDAILEILLNNLVVGKYNGEGGLATLLNHTIEDLDIRIVSAVYTPSSDPDSTSAGTIKVTIKLGNVNYWTEDLIFDIDVTKVNIKPVYGPLGRTSSYVTMTKDGAPYDVDGKVFYLIYKKADGDDGSWSYADYRNLTPVVNVEMVKNPYITGRYTATYDALPNGDYVMFAIAENYTIV
mgnify:CR=1 FL=1